MEPRNLGLPQHINAAFFVSHLAESVQARHGVLVESKWCNIDAHCSGDDAIRQVLEYIIESARDFLAEAPRMSIDARRKRLQLFENNVNAMSAALFPGLATRVGDEGLAGNSPVHYRADFIPWARAVDSLLTALGEFGSCNKHHGAGDEPPAWCLGSSIEKLELNLAGEKRLQSCHRQGLHLDTAEPWSLENAPEEPLWRRVIAYCVSLEAYFIPDEGNRKHGCRPIASLTNLLPAHCRQTVKEIGCQVAVLTRADSTSASESVRNGAISSLWILLRRLQMQVEASDENFVGDCEAYSLLQDALARVARAAEKRVFGKSLDHDAEPFTLSRKSALVEQHRKNHRSIDVSNAALRNAQRGASPTKSLQSGLANPTSVDGKRSAWKGSQCNRNSENAHPSNLSDVISEPIPKTPKPSATKSFACSVLSHTLSSATAGNRPLSLRLASSSKPSSIRSGSCAPPPRMATKTITSDINSEGITSSPGSSSRRSSSYTPPPGTATCTTITNDKASDHANSSPKATSRRSSSFAPPPRAKGLTEVKHIRTSAFTPPPSVRSIGVREGRAAGDAINSTRCNSSMSQPSSPLRSFRAKGLAEDKHVCASAIDPQSGARPWATSDSKGSVSTALGTLSVYQRIQSLRSPENHSSSSSSPQATSCCRNSSPVVGRLDRVAPASARHAAIEERLAVATGALAEAKGLLREPKRRSNQDGTALEQSLAKMVSSIEITLDIARDAAGKMKSNSGSPTSSTKHHTSSRHVDGGRAVTSTCRYDSVRQPTVSSPGVNVSASANVSASVAPASVDKRIRVKSPTTSGVIVGARRNWSSVATTQNKQRNAREKTRK